MILLKSIEQLQVNIMAYPSKTDSQKLYFGIPGIQVLFLFLLTAMFFINFTIRIIASPLLPSISLDLGLSHDEGGSLFLISASGYFISLICSGFVSSRLGHRNTIVLSAVSAGICFVMAGMSANLVSIRLGMFAVGMTAALYLPSGMAMLTASIDSKNWGKAVGVHELAPNLSFLLSPLICEVFLLFLPWRSVFFAVGAVSIGLGVSYLKFSGGNDFFGESPTFSAFIPLIKKKSFWIMVVLFSLGVIGTLGVYSMLPLFLVDIHGMPRPRANSLITLSRIFTLPMPFVIGLLSDRFGLKPILSAVLFLTGACTLSIGMLGGKWVLIPVFIQPLMAVCFFPPAFAALSQIGSKEIRNISISFTVPIAFLVGGGLVPNGIGILADAGFFSAGFVIAGLCSCLGAVIPCFLTLIPEG